MQALGYEPPITPSGGVVDGSKRLLASLQYTIRRSATDDEGVAPRDTRPAVYLGCLPNSPEERVVIKACSHAALLDHEVRAPWALGLGSE